MNRLTPSQMMWLGFFLLVLGFVLPFLMVLQFLESNLLTTFIAYLASFSGLVIGLMGVVEYARIQKKDKNE
ncbi:MAG: hypothetical protein L0Y55_02345 [Anaerolineales bacterium]|nr:hypothetical protein [Anaerolineales bacterium]